MLKSAGCYRIMFGVESGNETVRNKIMNRNMTDEQIVAMADEDAATLGSELENIRDKKEAAYSVANQYYR